MYILEVESNRPIKGDVPVTSLPVDVRLAKGLVTFKMPENIGSVALISHPADRRRAQIWGLRVDSEFRGRKIASSLMRSLRQTAENIGIQELHTYAANERTAHLMGAEFGDLPMKFGKRDQLMDEIEPFPAHGIDEVISWVRTCRRDEYPDDPAGTDELLMNSALIVVDLRPRLPDPQNVCAAAQTALVIAA
jgi:GNAT superfamily N-acetyltransferase